MLWIVLTVLLGQIPQAPRDAPPPRAGTGIIRGRVLAADTGLPLRLVIVTMMAMPSQGTPPLNRSQMTDAEGRFEFSALSAGTYRLRANPGVFRARYLGVAFGGKQVRDAGVPIELKEGQVFEQAEIALPRGAAITGRVTDEFGEPVSRVSVYPSRAMPGTANFQRSGAGDQSDDLGQFRIYGLDPGEYVVVAESRGGGGPPVEGETEGFAPTYYPSALNERDAMKVRLRGAEDVGGVEIRLVRTRTFRITGMVMDSQGRPVVRPSVMLIRSTGSTGFSSVGSTSFDQVGRFTIRDVAPGDYRVVVRPLSTGSGGMVTSYSVVGGVVGGVVSGSQTPAPMPQEYANLPLSVASDIDDLVVVTQPPASITGHIVFTEAIPLNVPTGLRVMTQPGDRMMPFGGSASATVTQELEFTLNNLMGPVLVRAAGFPPDWAMKAVMLGQSDITDTPIEFKPEHTKQLQIVLTTRASSIEGVITDEQGVPVAQATVLAIPEGRSTWSIRSPRLRVSRAVKEGRFTLIGLLPGRYYVVALPEDRVMGPDLGAEFFEPLTKDATVVVLGEDERRTIDLRLAKESR